jgi:uracil-DNA glycosylase family 4
MPTFIMRRDNSAMNAERSLAVLQERIISCRKCPRLVRYREEVARKKRRAFLDWNYWGAPVPGFGDPGAELLIIGLAPAAHGANRTGRVFTGDRSGEFLYKHLYRAGFANQPTSEHPGDGLKLWNAYISATVRCAPPANKPLPSEIHNCQRYLVAELDLLQPRAVLALGRIAFDSYLRILVEREEIPSRGKFLFAHGASFALPAGLPKLFASYHPSQQNTQTGKLTPRMFLRVLRQISRFLNR